MDTFITAAFINLGGDDHPAWVRADRIESVCLWDSQDTQRGSRVRTLTGNTLRTTRSPSAVMDLLHKAATAGDPR